MQAAPVPGHSYRFPFSITQEQINAFAAISGDTNPIHLDADFAARGEFGGRIAHGVLVLGVFSKVFGTLLFADGQVLVALEARFLGPVRPDQPHIALVTVSSVDLHKARVTYSLEMMAPDGTSVLKGSCKLMESQTLRGACSAIAGQLSCFVPHPRRQAWRQTSIQSATLD